MQPFVVRGLLPAALVALLWWLTVNAPVQAGFDRGDPRPPRPLVAVDSSGQGHDGVNQGHPRVGLAGFRGTSYSFRRAGSWIQVPPRPSLNPGNRDFSFTAWVNLGVAAREGGTYDIVRKGLSRTSGGEFKVEVTSDGRVHCSAKDARGRDGSVTGPDVSVVDGTWHRIGCARTGRTWSAIVDGSVTSKRPGLGSISNAMPLSIGSKYGHEDGTPGRVDEVRLVIADPPGEAESRAGSPARTSPAGLWHLDERPRLDLLP